MQMLRLTYTGHNFVSIRFFVKVAFIKTVVYNINVDDDLKVVVLLNKPLRVSRPVLGKVQKSWAFCDCFNKKGGVVVAYTASTIAKHIINYCYDNDVSISNLKLQKLLYFAWIACYKKMEMYLFDDEICAWKLGPVIPDVYFEYCVFGGKPIYRKYEDAESLEEKTQITLEEFLDDTAKVPASALVKQSHSIGGAWDTIYKNGQGNHAPIPYSMIIKKECI